MRKVFIINIRSNSRTMAMFKNAIGAFDPSHLSDCEFVYTEYAGHASDIARNTVSEAKIEDGICDTVAATDNNQGIAYAVLDLCL